jgi:hypothetical protein
LLLTNDFQTSGFLRYQGKKARKKGKKEGRKKKIIMKSISKK